jgi:hypothetical protein
VQKAHLTSLSYCPYTYNGKIQEVLETEVAAGVVTFVSRIAGINCEKKQVCTCIKCIVNHI